VLHKKVRVPPGAGVKVVVFSTSLVVDAGDEFEPLDAAGEICVCGEFVPRQTSSKAMTIETIEIVLAIAAALRL
jgi:hypothetical protein